jgi:hypothetical protein
MIAWMVIERLEESPAIAEDDLGIRHTREREADQPGIQHPPITRGGL